MDLRLAELEQALQRPADSKKPKYAALRDELLVQISKGDWLPGEKLPTEADMVDRLPLSLGTIQKAYHALAQDGAIQRRRGHGSFVTRKGQMPDPLHCTFVAENGEVLPVFPTVQGIARFTASERLSQLFNGETDLFRIDRQISVNDEFHVWNRFYVTFAIAEPIVSMPKEELNSANFKLLLRAADSHRIAHIFQQTIQGTDHLLSEVSVSLARKTVFTVTARAVDRDHTTIYVQEMLVPKTHRPLASQVSLQPGDSSVGFGSS